MSPGSAADGSAGLALIERAAATPSDSRIDALFALVLMYNRERRYDEALKALQELRRLHPRNRLVVLESGSTALRAGRAEQAENAADRRVGDAGRGDARPDARRGRAVALQARRRPPCARPPGPGASRTCRSPSGPDSAAVGPRPGPGRAGPRRTREGRPGRRPRPRRARRRRCASRAAIPSAWTRRDAAREGLPWPVRSRPGSGSSLGVVIACVVTAVAVAGSAFYFLSQHIRDAHRDGRDRRHASSNRPRRASAGRSRWSNSIATARLPAPTPTRRRRADTRVPEQRHRHGLRSGRGADRARDAAVLAAATEEPARVASTSTASRWTSRT